LRKREQKTNGLEKVRAPPKALYSLNRKNGTNRGRKIKRNKSEEKRGRDQAIRKAMGVLDTGTLEPKKKANQK